MSAIKLIVDEETGELRQSVSFVHSDSVPAIKIDINDVAVYHNEPSTLVDLISSQAAYAVFDVSTKKGRDACKAHAANIIRCISPAINESKRLAAQAKKVCNQDVFFRKEFEQGIRTLAAFHRQPLTEYEEKQERIIQAEKDRIQDELDYEKYLSDWDDAINLDELFRLRKAREIAEKMATDEAEAIEKERQFNEAVAARVEAMKKAEKETNDAREQAKINYEKYLSDKERQFNESIAVRVEAMKKSEKETNDDREIAWVKRSPEELRESANRIEEQAKYADTYQSMYDDIDRAKNLRKQADEIEAKQNKPNLEERWMIIEVVAELFSIDEYDAERKIIILFEEKTCGI